MAHIFISYSREDSIFAHQLYDAIHEKIDDIWVDWEDIPASANWWQEICKGIEAADIFVFLMTPSSVLSPICNLEISHAVKYNKRIIPIVKAVVDETVIFDELQSKTLNEGTIEILGDRQMLDVARESWLALASHNWLLFTDETQFNQNIQKLFEVINTDLDYVELHTRLLVRARQWEDAKQDRGRLLTGSEIDEAETWQASNNKQPEPTRLHITYILESRQRQRQQTQRLLGAVSFALLLTIVLVVVAVMLAFDANNQRNTAETLRQEAVTNAQESRARELAASSMLFAENQPDTAILLALESIDTQSTFEGRNALLSGLLTQQNLIGYFDGHSDFVRAVAINHDGTRLATGGRDGTIIIWDTSSHLSLLELNEHDTRVNVVAFSPDGSQLVSGGFGEIFIWDTSTGDIIANLILNRQEIRAASFSPDGEILITANAIGEITRWSTEDYHQIDITEAHEGGVIYDLNFSPDGSIMVTGGDDNSIHVWDMSDFTLKQIIPAHTDWVLSLAISPDGQYLASGSVDQSVRVWNLETGENLWAFRGHQSEIFALTFSGDGQFLISGGLDDFVITWDALSGELRSSFATYDRTGVRSLATYNNSLYIVGNNKDVVEVNIGFVPRFGTRLNTVQEEILTTAIHPDGTIAYAGGFDENFAIYIQESDSEESLSIPLHTGSVTDLAWSNNRLISVGVDRQVGIIENNEVLGIIEPRDTVYSVASHDNLIALGANRGNVELWDISGDNSESWSQIALLEGHNSRVNDLDFNADGTKLVSVDLQGMMIIWNVETGEAITEPLMAHDVSVETVRFSPDGSLITSGGRDSTIMLWDATTGEQASPPLIQHENWVNDIAFSPDGSVLASVSGDSSLILWSTETERAIGLPFFGHRGWVNSLSFSDDGSYIITGGRDGNLIQWEVTLDKWIATACEIVNRDLTPGEIRDFFGDTYQPHNSCSNRDS